MIVEVGKGSLIQRITMKKDRMRAKEGEENAVN